MKYSHKYSKLDKEEYTTIRRYSKGKAGQLVMETYPGGSHESFIYKVERKSFNEMSDDFLFNDTDCNNREDVIKLFNSFYKNPIKNDEKLYVYYLKRMYKEDESFL